MGPEATGPQGGNASIPIVHAPQPNILVHQPGPQMAANSML